MISLKPGVFLTHVHPMIVFAVTVADWIWTDVAHTNLVVTSVNDGEHQPGSLHYLGRAADLRIKNVPVQYQNTVHARLRDALGADFDVLFESPGAPNAHIHVEYDPKSKGGSP